VQDTVVVALIAVGGTVGTAVLGYAATRHSTRTQLKAAAEATRGQLGALKHEIRKLDADRSEELRGRREGVYQEFLNALYGFRDFCLGAKSVEAEGKEFDVAGTSLRERQVEMELLASDRVREKATETFDFLLGILDTAAESDDESIPFDKHLKATFKAEQLLWKLKRKALIAAMRSETQLLPPS